MAKSRSVSFQTNEMELKVQLFDIRELTRRKLGKKLKSAQCDPNHLVLQNI